MNKIHSDLLKKISSDFMEESISSVESYNGVVGNTGYLEEIHGISPEKIANRIEQYTFS